MKFNLNSFLLATSTALDLVEEEIMQITTNHSKRCAYISLRIAIEMNLTKEECFDLCSLALMHDNGITQAFYNQNWLEAGGDRNLHILEKFSDHCKIGEKNVKNFPFFTSPKNVILYHHEYLDGSGTYGLKGKDIPLMSQIICFADDIDMHFNLLDSSVDGIGAIQSFASENKNKLFDENVVDAFLRLSTKISFWRDLKDEVIIDSITNYLPEIHYDIEPIDLLDISYTFSTIIDAKSSFIASSSNALMLKAKKIAEFLEWDEEKSIYFQVAANLHDIGSLSTPSEILEKDGKLSKEEFEKVKEHANLTHAILGSIDGFDKINQWASEHHERNDGSGYPFGLKGDELSLESKILSCLDMYQALVEERPYREALSHDMAIETLYKQVPKNLFEEHIVELISVVFSIENIIINTPVLNDQSNAG